MSPHQHENAVDAGTDFVKQRLQSLDAYRGLIMISLAFVGFGLADTARNHLKEASDSKFWGTVFYQFSHVEWVGCAFWDMIQPSFMFMVGVSMAYSYAKRRSLGHSWFRMLRHAIWRSLVLIFLGIFLISNWSESTVWTLVNVLTQIGLGYTFLYLLWGKSIRFQTVTAATILVGTWLLYMCYPGAGIDLVAGAPDVGVSSAWAQQNLAGLGSAWHKNANIGHAVDLWLLNLLPQTEAFTFNRGGYHTLNFIPSLATMLFGLMCGELLRTRRSAGEKLGTLIIAGLAGLLVGQILQWTGVCPIIKRIWTPSWALFSMGWCCLFLATLYWIIDIVELRRWAFPLVVVGLNSIAMYCMGMLLRGWVIKTLKIHCGPGLFTALGEAYEPMLRFTLAGLAFWLICWWMYRKKVFIRI